MTPSTQQTVDQKIAGDGYSSSEAMTVLTTLCDDFGSRFGGTPGERQAAEFMAERLRAYGLADVHLEPFSYTAWRRGSAVLKIIDPIEKELDCISLPYSPAADMSATLVDLGDGSPADFADHQEKIDGKIVMANSIVFPKGMNRWVHRSEKYGRSLLHGAVGFIFMNHYPAYGPATGGIGHRGSEALIPGISVSYEDGAFLQRLLRKSGSVTLHLRTTDSSEPAESWNVIGNWPGKSDNPEIIMVGSHYDGHDISQGAQDPASGAAAVIETARLLANHAGNLPHTVRFALWGVEELGLLGSRAYVETHQNELDSIRFYFNMDGAGAVKNKGVVLNEWPALETLISRWRETMALDFGIDQSVNAFSDHYPFLLKGVPTGGLQSVPAQTGGRGYGHTRYDTLDKVTLRELQDAAVLAARLVVRLASEEKWPVTRRTQNDVDAILNRPAYQETGLLAEQVDAFYQQHRSSTS